MATKQRKPSSIKRSAKRHTLNAGGHAVGGGAPFNEQDIKRRMGNFTGAGEHSRQGGRTGIVKKKGLSRTENNRGSDGKGKRK